MKEGPRTARDQGPWVLRGGELNRPFSYRGCFDYFTLGTMKMSGLGAAVMPERIANPVCGGWL